MLTHTKNPILKQIFKNLRISPPAYRPFKIQKRKMIRLILIQSLDLKMDLMCQPSAKFSVLTLNSFKLKKDLSRILVISSLIHEL